MKKKKALQGSALDDIIDFPKKEKSPGKKSVRCVSWSAQKDDATQGEKKAY